MDGGIAGCGVGDALRSGSGEMGQQALIAWFLSVFRGSIILGVLRALIAQLAILRIRCIGRIRQSASRPFTMLDCVCNLIFS